MNTEDPPEKKFDDCDQCKHFHRRHGHLWIVCRMCTIGEHFTEKIDDTQPDDNELMRIYARMPKDE